MTEKREVQITLSQFIYANRKTGPRTEPSGTILQTDDLNYSFMDFSKLNSFDIDLALYLILLF